MRACCEREASSRTLGFNRLDYPQSDPPEWTKLITLRLKGGEMKRENTPSTTDLRAPYASDFEENYRRHCGL